MLLQSRPPTSPPPLPPPSQYSRGPPDPSLHHRRIQDLETKVCDLSKQVLDISTKLATQVMQGNQSQPSQNSVMVAAELDRRQVAEEEVGKVANLEKAVSRLQEDKVNISSKVAALEKVVTHHTTTLDHDMVPKVSNLEKDVAKKIQNNDTQLAHKVEENTREAYAIRQTLIQHMDIVGNLETDVRNLEKEVAKKNNDNSANDTTSIIKKITEIEEILQGSDKLGKEFKHLDDRVIQLKNNSDSNTYMLHSINVGVYHRMLDGGYPQPNYAESHQGLVEFNCHLDKCRKLISKANPNHWDKAVKFLNQNDIRISDYQVACYHQL